jgi:hypothetical protein
VDSTPPAKLGLRALWWFLVPLLSAGFGTFLIVFHASLLARSRQLLVAAVAYLVLDVLFLVNPNGGNGVAAGLFIVVAWMGGTIHAIDLAARHRRSLRRAAPKRTRREIGPRPDHALAAARLNQQRRLEARRIVDDDLPLAAELRIGRPDLPRTYVDGGLVDVNHVPVELLVSELDMQPAVADEVATVRVRRNGFTSADDMLLACDSLNPARMDMLRDRLIFVPRDIEPGTLR